jgi:thioester reductase-like protein
VLHNGALVNFLFDYRAHRSVNVHGTAELLRLAMAHRPAPVHHVSTLAALLGEAPRHPGPLAEQHDVSRAEAPAGGYNRSKWVAERYLAAARRRGAVITVLRLGEVMPSADNTYPNPRALTHLLLSAFHRLGACPDVTIRSDYTPVDYVASRVVAAVLDREAWGRTLHVFHPESVCFTEAFARFSPAGAPASRITCADFLARLSEAARETGDRELTTLAALLPSPDGVSGVSEVSGEDENALRRIFSELLTDNAALFRKDECRKLEQRWQLTDGQLDGPIAAYHAYLEG